MLSVDTGSALRQAQALARSRQEPVIDPPAPEPQAPAPVAAHDEATVAATAAVAAASSTSRSFPSADAAARDALSRANPLSIRDNLEYGGLVFKDPVTGRYSASAPLKGSDTGFAPSKVPVPKNAQVVGDYHTHGDYSLRSPNGEVVRTSDPARDNLDSDTFSRQDLRGIRADAAGKAEYTGYLGTPSGTFRRFDPTSGADTVMPRVRTSPVRGALTGAAVGAAAEAGLSTAQALADGHITRQEAGDILSNSARGAVVGGSYAVTEQGLVRVADRAVGPAVERAATQVASRVGAAEAGAMGPPPGAWPPAWAVPARPAR